VFDIDEGRFLCCEDMHVVCKLHVLHRPIPQLDDQRLALSIFDSAAQCQTNLSHRNRGDKKKDNSARTSSPPHRRHHVRAPNKLSGPATRRRFAVGLTRQLKTRVGHLWRQQKGFGSEAEVRQALPLQMSEPRIAVSKKRL
jgi:hypothetical protein